MAPDDKSDAIKLCVAWAACGVGKLVDSLHSVGITNWGEASQAAATVLSLCLICNFFWRKLFRRWFSRRWPKAFPTRRRRRDDFVDSSGQET